MSKHKHYDMIVAKAENTELSVLLRPTCGVWREYECGGFPAFSSGDYFLCLPQHKEAVLNSLNGGQSQATKETGNGEFQDVYTGKPSAYWTVGGWYMSEKCESRIKPSKQKRWIAFNHNNGNVYGTFSNEQDCSNAWPELQRLEIEVEV